MIGKGFEKGWDSSRRMCIRSTFDILPKGEAIQNLHIPPNRNSMRSIANIPRYAPLRRTS